jgi:urease subunit beta
VLQVSNPKALLFFTALLPPFIDPGAPVVAEVALLGVTSVVIEFVVLLAYGALAGRLSTIATRPRFQTAASRVAGAIAPQAGVRVAFQKTPDVEVEEAGVIPGEYLLGEGDIVANEGRATVELVVANTGDRPIQVGSHFHFFEVNRALRFDRARAFGMRLNVPAGTAVRFEPGDEKRVTLVEIAGARRVFGLNALSDGGDRDAALRRLAAWQALR